MFHHAHLALTATATTTATTHKDPEMGTGSIVPSNEPTSDSSSGERSAEIPASGPEAMPTPRTPGGNFDARKRRGFAGEENSPLLGAASSVEQWYAGALRDVRSEHSGGTDRGLTDPFTVPGSFGAEEMDGSAVSVAEEWAFGDSSVDGMERERVPGAMAQRMDGESVNWDGERTFAVSSSDRVSLTIEDVLTASLAVRNSSDERRRPSRHRGRLQGRGTRGRWQARRGTPVLWWLYVSSPSL